MCGLAGFVDFTRITGERQLHYMTDALLHRGPDDSGYSFYKNKLYSIGLGHRRLSILDLSSHGHQPMKFQNFEVVYNGEIYNFKEIRRELEKLDYVFNSESDTEVIIKAYDKWGVNSVHKLNGMFVIVIYDSKADKLIIIRDRSGVKPCYYYMKNDLILFSSELKSFHKHSAFEKQINNKSLGLYLQYGYIPEPYSIFKNTFKLRAGHYLEIDLSSKKVTEKKYWNVIDFYNKPKLKIDEKEAFDKVEEIMNSAFNYRMISDVPVGVFLSGGYDSSIVTAMLQKEKTEKINTFTIGFKEKGYDEAPDAKKVAEYLGTNHTEYYCSQSDALKILPKLCEIYDEPFGDSSSIPTILVSQLAREKVTVSLSADGGDEIFAGYSKYDLSLKYNKEILSYPPYIRKFISSSMGMINPNNIPLYNKKFNFETKYFKLKNILKSKDVIDILNITSQHFTNSQINSILREEFVAPKTNFDLSINNLKDDINKMLAIDYKTYMVDDVLTKVDRATMSVGLEGREPLLDYRLIEFVAQLPSSYKLNEGKKKWMLKKITHKYLPKEIMDRPKKGFGVPLMDWFRDELKGYFIEYLSEDRIERQGVFNTKEIIRLRDRFLNGENESATRLWYILMFQMWHEKWMKNND